MEFYIKNDHHEISYKGDGLVYSQVKDLLDIFYESSDKPVIPKQVNINNNIDKSVSIPTIEERPAFRDRLPNNVVDLSKLDVQQAVTENALVRCPTCGQCHCLSITGGIAGPNNFYLMRKNYSTNEFDTIGWWDNADSLFQACCTDETDREAYFYDLQNAQSINKEDFVVENDTEIFCPVCRQSSSFHDWKDAWENPLNYFETELLCDACGGEMIPKMVKNTKICKCEKCGHETPYKE